MEDFLEFRIFNDHHEGFLRRSHGLLKLMESFSVRQVAFVRTSLEQDLARLLLVSIPQGASGKPKTPCSKKLAANVEGIHPGERMRHVDSSRDPFSSDGEGLGESLLPRQRSTTYKGPKPTR